NQAFEGDWTYGERGFGRIFSVQFADLTGTGRLEVVVNRYDPRARMNSFIVGVANGKPTALVEDFDSILLAVDEQGTGVKRTLWAQRYRSETLVTKAPAEELALKGRKPANGKTGVAPETLRRTGATITSV